MYLDYITDVTFKQKYGDREIETNISRKSMKNLLVLCAKNIHFIFVNNIYLLKGGVTMRYSLRPLLRESFMVHVEGILLLKTRDIYETLEKICR